MKILFFDIQITGHHSEYIGHLINYITYSGTVDECYFVVHPLFTESFPEIAKRAAIATNIHWILIETKELGAFEKTGMLRRSVAAYTIMNKYALQYKADHVVLLYLNTLQLALGLFRPAYTISGILFKQFYRMNKKGSYVQYYRKFFQTWFFTLNSRITRVFILNDQETVDFLNSKFNTAIFSMLPDPVPDLSALEGFDIYEEYKIAKDKKIFLHLGSLGERKGTPEIIEAAALLSPDTKNKIVVLLVGKTNTELAARINERIQRPDLRKRVIWDNNFVSDEKMKSLFSQCYCVLMPYKNAEASSGILGHAAASGKMVIASGKGLLKDMVNKYGLGLLVGEVTPELIAAKIEESVRIKFQGNKSGEFIETRTGNYFALKIFSIMANDQRIKLRQCIKS